ncbi:MAG TPA: ABC transporter permease [Jatrophihabitans sp.]|nr:ABC transporter permease [Jatrophihabitans sp.]
MDVSISGVRAASYYALLRYRRVWRGTVVISVANPALFLTGLGFGLGKLVDHRHSHYLAGASYIAFLAPGLLAAAMMQTAYIESAGPVHNAARSGGAYRVATATPVTPAEVFLAQLSFVAFRVATSATAFALVAWAFRAVPIAGVLPLILAATLTGLAFGAPIAAWAVTMEHPATINAGFRFVIMPMYMFCGTFFAVSQLPGWLQAIVRVTPLYHGVTLCRAASTGHAGPLATIAHLGYLAALVGIGALAGTRSFRRVLTA